MNYLKLLFIYCSLLFLCGCSQHTQESVEEDTVELAEAGIFKSSNISFDERIRIYFDKEIELSLYEPENGAYTGAYILSNKQVDFDINNFEALTGKEHSMYTFYSKIGSQFPQDWILSCIANLKTPNIVLFPENESEPFRKGIMTETAKQFGEFYVPVFLQFYPDMRQKGYDPEGYIEFYRYTREIFRQYASNVAFVWCVSEEDIPDFMDYYPGDDYVDWIGINLYENISEEGTPEYNDSDIFNKIDYVYYTFQDRKPIMISQLGVSHFSTVNHTYYSDEAGEEIKRIYEGVADKYPRIKAINYMDYNSYDAVNRKPGKDNYSVTGSQTVLAYYKEVIQDQHFLSALDYASGGEQVNQLLNSSFEGYKISDEYYISEYSLKYELDLDYSGYKNNFIDIEGKKYIALDTIGLEYKKDEENSAIVIPIQ